MPNLKKLLLPALLLLTHATTLFARAGGGGSFHGGGGGGGFGGGHSSGGGFGGGGSWGGSGGGSYGGGSSSLTGTDIIIFLIIAAIVIAIRVYQQYNTSFGNTPDSSNDSPSRPTPQIQPNALELLRQSDPTFNPPQFYARIQTAFLALQAAWSNQNLDQVRPFISDAILERFNIQFTEQKFLGYRNLVTTPTVSSITLVQTLSDHLYDTAIVRIHASAIDTNITPDGKPFRDNPGSPSNQPFTEYWSFLRKRGAKSVPSGLIEGHCPNCGAAIDINQNANCPYCKAALKNAEYDWVLTEITQESQFQLTTPNQIPGLPLLLTRDPNFTTTDLEDRTSVIFWRLSLADRTASTNPLRKIAPTNFLHLYAQHFTPDPHGTRHLYLDAGVGSVTTLSLRPNVPDPSTTTLPPASPTSNAGVPPASPTQDSGLSTPPATPPTPPTQDSGLSTPPATSSDYALIEITWSGILYTLSPNTPPHRTSQDDLLHSWYVLKRSSTSLTDPETTLSSTHCPNCGAPLTNSASPACDFCNTPLTDGTHGWLLTKITPKNDPTLRQFFNLTRPLY